MMLSLSIVILLGVGVILSPVFFRPQRLLTFLAAAGVLSEGLWIFLTALSRVVFPTLPSDLIFLVGSMVLLLLAGLVWWPRKQEWYVPLSAVKDGWVVLVLGITLLSAWSVGRVNGYLDGAWVTHGFYNGDVATFRALTERSLVTRALVTANPFAGGGGLEYPVLLHAAVASVFFGLGMGNGWEHFLPIMTLVQIVITVPLFFLLWDIVWPEPGQAWQKWFGVPTRWIVYGLQAAIVLLVMTLAWDNYVYPQSHFFLTGLFLLATALLVQAQRERGWQQMVGVGCGVVFVFLLVASNAVMGTAAAALAVLFAVIRTADLSRSPAERGSYLVAGAGMVALFLLITPGGAAFSLIPHFSYVAAIDMIRLTPVLVFLLVGAWQLLGRQSFLTAGVALLLIMGFWVFLFSSRNIIVDNASRFFYHALLIGFPLLLPPLLQGYWWLKRELVTTSHTIVEQLAGWFLLISTLGFLGLPALASVASAHDNLWQKDEQRVSVLERGALEWVKENTAPEAIFLSAPTAPFSIPVFTGRAVLRTDYWLSPDDRVLADVQAAFAGDRAAQEQVLSQVDYVYLRVDERERFEPLPLKKVFDNGQVVIYSTQR